MKIEEKKVLVVGTGISGIAAAKLLLEKKILRSSMRRHRN